MKLLTVFILVLGICSCRDYPESKVFNLRTQETLFNMKFDMQKHQEEKKKRNERLRNLVL